MITTVLTKEFDINNLKVSTPSENNKGNNKSIQLSSEIKYNINGKDVNFCLQTPKFCLIGGGLMSKNYMMDNKIQNLAQFKMPLKVLNSDDIKNNNDKIDLYKDTETFEKQIKQFREVIIQIDEYFKSDDFKTKIFGDKDKGKYNYIPMYKDVDLEDVQNKISYNKYKNKNTDTKVYAICDYLKLRFKCKFTTDDFVLWSKTYTNNENVKTELNNVNYTELTKNISYRDNLLFLINFQKMYVNKVADSKSKLKDYGVILQLDIMDIYPKQKDNSIKFIKELRVVDDEEEVKNDN